MVKGEPAKNLAQAGLWKQIRDLPEIPEKEFNRRMGAADKKGRNDADAAYNAYFRHGHPLRGGDKRFICG